MRDLKKWVIGVGTTLAITLVGAVLDMRSSVSSMSTTVKLTNEHFEKALIGNQQIDKEQNRMFDSLDKRVVRLEAKDLADDAEDTKYNNKIDRLVPLVQSIEYMMKRSSDDGD